MCKNNFLTIAGGAGLAMLIATGPASASHISQAGVEDCQALIVAADTGLIDETNATWFGGRDNRDGDNAILATLISKLEDADHKLDEADFLLDVGKVAGAEEKATDAGGKLVNYQSKVDSLPSSGNKKKIHAADQAYLSAEAQTAIDCVADLLIHE
jgi:hypothetical protein